MRINHLILGARDSGVSALFYEKLLGFQRIGTFIDTGTGGEGIILRRGNEGMLVDLLIVPFEEKRLPNPQHFAVEVDISDFQDILQRARNEGLKVRGEPALSSPESGPGVLKMGEIHYQNFYFLDPSGINVEIMWRKQ